ncbi:hypothetical protein ADL26_20630, partial [Thermoactinomyces vulgaris]
MAKLSQEDLLEQFSEMTLIELSEFVKAFEEKFDVDLQFETTTYDGTAAGEKRQISLASGDYPDAYMLIP